MGMIKKNALKFGFWHVYAFTDPTGMWSWGWANQA